MRYDFDSDAEDDPELFTDNSYLSCAHRHMIGNKDKEISSLNETVKKKNLNISDLTKRNDELGRENRKLRQENEKLMRKITKLDQANVS